MTWWTGAITMGASMLGSMLGRSAQKAAVRNQRLIDKANADAANAVRGANNKLAATNASTNNLMRVLGNQAKLQSGGDAVNAVSTNLVRLHDQATTGSLNQQIAAAEQLGAVKAQAAASGAGGTSSVMLHQTMQLAHARAETSRSQQATYQTYDMLAQRAGIQSNMVQSLDFGQDFAAIDHSITLTPYRAEPSGNLLTDFLQSGGAQMIGNMAGGLFGGAGAKTAAPVLDLSTAASSAQAFPINIGSSIASYLLK